MNSERSVNTKHLNQIFSFFFKNTFGTTDYSYLLEPRIYHFSVVHAHVIWLGPKGPFTRCSSGCGTGAAIGLKCFATAAATQNGVWTHLLATPCGNCCRNHCHKCSCEQIHWLQWNPIDSSTAAAAAAAPCERALRPEKCNYLQTNNKWNHAVSLNCQIKLSKVTLTILVWLFIYNSLFNSQLFSIYRSVYSKDMKNSL